MPWSQTRDAALAALIALVAAVAFTAAPAAAVDGADATQAEESDDEFPEEFCTDVTGAVGDEVPYDQVIWVDDLPEDAQPPGVPWSVITPRAVAGIVLGATPNQCDVFDPNDPPYDPREDEVDPDGGGDVGETDDGTTLIVVNGTLDSTSDGPGGEAIIEFEPSENGELDPEVRINDGEKDYVLDPGVQYWDDGTVYLENDVIVMGKRAGVEFDCIGEECELDIRGAPGLVDYPSIPSHSEEDPRDDTGDGGEGDEDGDGDVDAPDDGEGTQDTNSDDGVDDPVDTDGDADGADGDSSGDGSDGNADGADGDSSADGSDDGDGSDDADDGDGDQSDDADGDDADEPAEAEDDDGDEPAQAQVDGPGFGAAAALLSVLAATLVARRRLS